MSITIPGLGASTKTPSVYLNVILGGPGTSAGAAPEKILLVGNLIGSALTGASPTFSVSAGSLPVDTPTFCASPFDAVSMCGAGSELARMAQAVFSQYPSANVYLCGVTESGGARASADLTVATTSTGAFTLRLRLCEKVVDVAVASGNTATVTAAAIADAINDTVDLPYTAQNLAGVVTITAKQVGPRGNSLIVDAYIVLATSPNERRVTTSSTPSTLGTTFQWTAVGAAIGAEYPLTGGTTADNFTNALAAAAATKYSRIVVAANDATNIGRLVTHLDTLAAVAVGIRQQGIAATIDTIANATTLATGLNASRLMVGWHHASKVPGPDVAAVLAAARLTGDTSVGGVLGGEASDPAANLDGVQLAVLLAQTSAADQPTATEVESALNNGLSCIVPSSARPGLTALSRSITSRSLYLGVPNYAVIDTSFVTTCDYVADDLQSGLAVTYQGFKLGADSADGTPPLSPNVTTPSLVRSYILDRLAGYEARAILRDVTANASLLAVEADLVTSGRLNCEIPCEPVSGLHIIAGNVRQLASL